MEQRADQHLLHRCGAITGAAMRRLTMQLNWLMLRAGYQSRSSEGSSNLQQELRAALLGALSM